MFLGISGEQVNVEALAAFLVGFLMGHQLKMSLLQRENIGAWSLGSSS